MGDILMIVVYAVITAVSVGLGYLLGRRDRRRDRVVVLYAVNEPVKLDVDAALARANRARA